MTPGAQAGLGEEQQEYTNGHPTPSKSITWVRNRQKLLLDSVMATRGQDFYLSVGKACNLQVFPCKFRNLGCSLAGYSVFSATLEGALCVRPPV